MPEILLVDLHDPARKSDRVVARNFFYALASEKNISSDLVMESFAQPNMILLRQLFAPYLPDTLILLIDDQNIGNLGDADSVWRSIHYER